MKPLHGETLELLKAFDRHAVAHILREKNKRADELANLSYDVPYAYVQMETPGRVLGRSGSIKGNAHVFCQFKRDQLQVGDG